ncbi:hypothetical protein C0V97_15615 [Asaia sp. W19]|uniref:DeoR/GlpR family DNA-binding transcription regulator n=2 Tax=Asaia TaxID=91914 RepID=UPI000F8DDF40|nr:DeoR/GlpR family DNA-binding transcription regulator [Asaia sp. W19]RUT24709.1 hypothetical protein C0V97_15615 [Asaia sp. W19]
MSMGVNSATLKRRLGIIDAVRRAGFLRTEALAEQFDVSMVTIRSDLAYLQSQNLVIRTNGGAQPAHDYAVNAPLDESPTLFEARALARAVAFRLKPGQCVFLDNSQAASFVPVHATAENLRFVVNSFETYHLACRTSDAAVSLLGGEYDRLGYPMLSPAADHALSFYDIDLAVISACQIGKTGFTCLDQTGNCLETALYRAKQVYLLTDRLDRVDEDGRVMEWRNTMSVLHGGMPPDGAVLCQDWTVFAEPPAPPE